LNALKLLILEHDSTIRRFRLIASCSRDLKLEPGGLMRSFACVAIALAAVLLAGRAAAQNDEPPPPPSEPPAEVGPAPTNPLPPGSPPGPAGRPTPMPHARPAAPRTASPEAPAATARATVRPPPAAHAAAPAHTAVPAPAAAAPHIVPHARLQAGQALPPPELEAFVDGFVQAAMARDHIAGVSVAVVQNGQVLLTKGYGFARLSPARPVDPARTLFRLGSLSKTFTWIGLMRQVEAGRIRLDQPINLYLPEKLRVPDQGYDQPVRGLDLMDHAAGFEDRAYGHLYEEDPDYVRPLELYLRQERPARVRPSGETASYSNYGAALAGAAEAWVGGKTFERMMEDDIFLPLGMNHTTFREARPSKAALPAPMPPALAADVADGFRWTADGFARQPYEYMGQVAPAASASSTASDMARYMLALLDGGRLGAAQVYGPQTAQAFHTAILTTPPGINGWAHGFMAEPLPGGRTGYGHAGATLAFASNLVTAPELNLGVFVAANTDTGSRLTQRLPEAIVQAFYAAPAEPRPVVPELAADAGAYEGRYLTTRRAYSGLEGFVGRLAGTTRVRVTPEGRLVTHGPAGDEVWVPEAAPEAGRFVAEAGETRLAFRMSDGSAAGFQTSPNAAFYERIAVWRSPAALAVCAGLTAAAATLTLIGAMLRNRREQRESAVQSRAAIVQNLQAGLWLGALAGFTLWMMRDFADPPRAAFRWPGAALVSASACALVAAFLTAATLLALPAVWRGGRRVDSWPVQRRAAYTVTTLIYTAFSVLLAQAGALVPWSG
jgi:CubicO group peptidase (beta-lactamase class C family)